MKRPPLLRRPGKLVLCTLLLAVTSAAAFLFWLQAWVDSITLEQSMDAYAYVGTLAYEPPVLENQAVAAQLQTAMDLAVLEDPVVETICASPHVTSADIRTTRAGLVEGVATVPDRMITTARLNQHYFIEGTVLSRQDSQDAGEYIYEFYVLRLERQWGGDLLQKGSLYVILYRTPEEPPLEPDSRVFLIGGYYPDGNGVRTDYTTVYTPGAAATIQGEQYADSILVQNTVAVIPEGADSEQWIGEYLERTGLLPCYEAYAALQNAVTVRQVNDLMMHPYFTTGRMFVESGRAIGKADAGKRVCIISQGLANRNRLNVGDAIRLSVADGCYTTSGLYPSQNGWESGFPMESEALLPYGEFEEYEIVGVFSTVSRDVKDPLFFGMNDILIPADGAASGAVRSYNFSFRVMGTASDAFRQELGSALADDGYLLKLRDTGWDDVEETFFALQDRRRIMTACAAAAFVLSALLFAVLANRNCRYGYGLKRLLGAGRLEAAGEYAAWFAAAGLPGTLTAALGALTGYVYWMRPAMAQVLSAELPGAAQCGGMLALTSAGVLGLSALLLGLLCAVEERRGLLRLLRR